MKFLVPAWAAQARAGAGSKDYGRSPMAWGSRPIFRGGPIRGGFPRAVGGGDATLSGLNLQCGESCVQRSLL